MFLMPLGIDFGTDLGRLVVPKWSQVGQHIDLKIVCFFDASWGQFLDGFWSIFDPEMDPSWHPNRTKYRDQLRNATLRKKIEKHI